MGTRNEKHDSDDRRKDHHKNDEPPRMIPRHERHPTRALIPPRLLGFDGSTVSRSHLLRAGLAADRAIVGRKKTTAIGAFVKIGAIELRTVVVSAEHFSHNIYRPFTLVAFIIA